MLTKDMTLPFQTHDQLKWDLGLPFDYQHSFVFECHPGIFYISKKGNTQTIILREAYNGPELLQKHPLVMIREELASMLKKGFLYRSRGLYK